MNAVAYVNMAQLLTRMFEHSKHAVCLLLVHLTYNIYSQFAQAVLSANCLSILIGEKVIGSAIPTNMDLAVRLCVASFTAAELCDCPLDLLSSSSFHRLCNLHAVEFATVAMIISRSQ